MHSKRQTESTRNKLIIALIILAEVICFAIVYYELWSELYVATGKFYPLLGRGKYILMGVYAVIAFVVLQMCEGLKFGYLKMADLMFAQWVAMFICNFITYFQLSLMANVMIAPGPMALVWVIDVAICSVFTTVYAFYYKHNAVSQNMLMIYGNKESAVLKLKMDTRGDKYRVSKLISVDEGMEKIGEEAKKFDAVVIADVSAEMRNDILKFCYMNDIRVYITPKISDVVIRGAKDINLFDSPLILVKTGGVEPLQAFVKRFFDILLSAIAIVITSPFMLITAICIKAEDGGPVFFKQKRCTINCQEFDIIKFRSMIVDADKDGYHGATENDDRITKVGHFIRAIRMDELPQLFNIIKGDMSLVGPRPERIENVQEYTDMIPEFVFRSKVKGGLTGYAQVYGKYNTSAYDKLKYDLMYIENYSIILDIRLILMTIRVLFKKESTEGFDKVLTADEVIEEMK